MHMQVPLGIELKSEQNMEDMIDILDKMQKKYVPTVSSVKVMVQDTEVEIQKHQFFNITLG